MEYRLECGVQLCPGSNPDLPTTSFRGPWEIDFERIFTLRNLEIRGFTGNYEPTGRGTARGCQNSRVGGTFSMGSGSLPRGIPGPASRIPAPAWPPLGAPKCRGVQKIGVDFVFSKARISGEFPEQSPPGPIPTCCGPISFISL